MYFMFYFKHLFYIGKYPPSNVNRNTNTCWASSTDGYLMNLFITKLPYPMSRNIFICYILTFSFKKFVKNRNLSLSHFYFFVCLSVVNIIRVISSIGNGLEEIYYIYVYINLNQCSFHNFRSTKKMFE